MTGHDRTRPVECSITVGTTSYASAFTRPGP
jgi:hypothetical protein